MHTWKVIPICERQRRDVRPEDLVRGGHFRLCDSYRGGGGYDQFPAIYERRFGEAGHNLQFVVQLKGCHLACPYCYVTPEGIFGEHVEYTTNWLTHQFWNTSATVFHLMGGAPALQLDHWPELINALEQFNDGRKWVFHSDLLLTESLYDIATLEKIARRRCLFAVNIKGLDSLEHLKNTGRQASFVRIWDNLSKLQAAKVPYYVTFTDVHSKNIDQFWQAFQADFPDSYELQKRDAFSIDLIEYEALKP